MGFNSFRPTLWAGTLLRQLERAHRFAQPGVINRDYEGEIKQKGDTVKITSIGPVTVSDYTRDTDISAPQALTDAAQTLVITQQKYYHFAIDDIDQAQAQDGGETMIGAMRQSSYSLRNTADRYLAGFYSQAASANFVGTDGAPKTISASTDVYTWLVDCKTALDEQDVPEEGRWAILASFLEGHMLKDDRFVKSGVLPAEQRLLNGMVMQAAGFSILTSNNLTHNGSGDLPVTGDEVRCMFGHPMAITFAEQIVKTEAYRPEKRFADAVKGLHVYGGKVVRPEALGVLTVTR